ncbi:MAG: hypothetical protein JWQ54_2238 [Mucilaginibacter sp.]|nr:hypothetical protein [Mucilaginibacter sp.]
MVFGNIGDAKNRSLFENGLFFVGMRSSCALISLRYYKTFKCRA